MRTTFEEGERPLSQAEWEAWERLKFDLIVSGLGDRALNGVVLSADVLRHPSIASADSLSPTDLIRQHMGDSFTDKL